MIWTCSKCDKDNPMLSMQCRKCGASKFNLAWPPPDADTPITSYKIDVSKRDN